MDSPLLVTGADGMLGRAVVRAAERQDVPVVALSGRELDVTDTAQVTATLGAYYKPTVINCAGIVRERWNVDPFVMALVNHVGPHILSLYAGRLLHVSTDCVFDGAITDGAYYEDSIPSPLDHYAQTKLAGEVTHGPHLTVRTSFIGLGQRGLVHWLLSHNEGAEVPGYTNWVWNGWTASALACLLIPLAMEARVTGLVHLPGPDVIMKGSLLKKVAERLRPDLRVVAREAPQTSRMVLDSNVVGIKAPRTSWSKMLDELEEEYRKECNVR